MKSYLDVNRDSGILGYDDSNDWIRVQFKSGAVYEYNQSTIGANNLATMKRLAVSGDGLNAFINTTPVVRGGGRKL